MNKDTGGFASVWREQVADPIARGLDELTSCHEGCTIGPNADHHGTMSYRCIDENGHGLPFPGERSRLIDLGAYSMHVFAEDDNE